MKKKYFLSFAAVFFLATLLLSLFSYVNYPEKLFVRKVIDGDTFEGDGYTIRLIGIDAPEKAQKCYEEAKNFLRKLIEGKTVRLEYDEEKRDAYGRVLAYVWVGGTFVNMEMIKNGYAVFRNYGKKLRHADILNLSPSGCVAGIDTCEECIGISYFLWNPEGDECSGNEFVKLKNYCDFPCNLSGWKIMDKDGNEFILGNILLNKTLYIYSGCGRSSKNKIFLCVKKQCKAIWNNDGDSFILINEKGNIVLNYTYS